MMNWKKLGLVWCPDGSQPWAKSHAMCPTPLRLNDDVIRVYVTSQDDQGRGRPGYVDVSARDPVRVLGISTNPVLDIGDPGTFDDNGVMAISVAACENDELYMYYAGFELCTHVRYRIFTGLALSVDGGVTFQRHSRTPVLDRTNDELFFRCGPFVLYGNQKFKLWYASGSSWMDLNGKQMPVYDLRYQESRDGIHWDDTGQLSLSLTEPDEHGFGRPWVVVRGERDYQLFYSIRRRSVAAYRLGYAESADGIHWVRKDKEMNLDVSSDGFDSDAIMYSAVIRVGDRYYCFYNGNNFGEMGFAVAELNP